MQKTLRFAWIRKIDSQFKTDGREYSISTKIINSSGSVRPMKETGCGILVW